MSIDKHFYFSIEKDGGWRPAKADQRQSVIEQHQPKYVTVLDLSHLVSDDMSAEDKLKVRYSGPFYADWDCEDLMEGAAAVLRFLDLLREDYAVDPASVQLYATGGRGYHIELPFETFCAHEPTIAAGLPFLPQIYRELANELYTQDLDLAVYSAQRGRMWRTPNVLRENGKSYKVPITHAQLREMTPELYAELCSAPRPFVKLTPPVYSAVLGSKFDDFKKKVTQRYAESKKRANTDEALKALGGQIPASVQQLMDGENISPHVGLNRIALQLGILANGLGLTLDQHVDACTGLIQKYRGDGHTTARAVRDEIKRMYRYASGNTAYSYSPNAMVSIMDDTGDASDLRGDPTAKGGSKQAERAAKGDLSDLMQGIVNGAYGTYSAKGEDSMKRESQWHFDASSATEVIDATSNKPQGFILRSLLSGVDKGEVNVDPLTFISSDSAKKFLHAQGAVGPRIDPQKAGGMMAAIMQAARNNQRVYALQKEGFNLVKSAEGEDSEQLVWASSEGCFATNTDRVYRYRSANGAEVGNFASDVAQAKNLTEHDNVVEVVNALLHFNNNPTTVACVLGWLGACWLKPLHHKYGSSFPLLELYGESGAGKTAIMLLLLKMYYLNAEPKATNASQGTSFGRRTMLSSSSTIPYFMDEFKPRHMSQDLVRELRSLFHELHTPSLQAPRGGGSGQAGSNSWHNLSFETKTTPLVFSTETAESETAIQERTIAAAFSKRNREGRARDAYNVLFENTPVLSSIGKAMLQGTMAGKPEMIKRLIDESKQTAHERLQATGNSRIAYNMGVVLSGLKLLAKVLHHKLGATVFEEHFRARFEDLQEHLLTPENHPTLVSSPVLVRMLRFMMTISWQDAADADHNVKEGVEFAYDERAQYLDLNVDAFFGRYKAACARRSYQPDFNDVESFFTGVGESSLCVGRQPPDSPLILKAGAGQAARVVRLAQSGLDEYNLGTFKIGDGR